MQMFTGGNSSQINFLQSVPPTDSSPVDFFSSRVYCLRHSGVSERLTTMNNIDRRSFMQRTGIAGLSLLALNLGSNRAVADPDPAPGGNGPTPVSPSAE